MHGITQFWLLRYSALFLWDKVLDRRKSAVLPGCYQLAVNRFPRSLAAVGVNHGWFQPDLRPSTVSIGLATLFFLVFASIEHRTDS